MSNPIARLFPILLLLGSVSPGPPAMAQTNARSFSVFDRSDMKREVHGGQEGLDLSAGAMSLGKAQAFFGVDDSSTATRRYLTSGLEWQAGPDDGPLDLRLGGMHTVSRGSVAGGQTLLQATSNFDLGGGAFVPDLSFMTARVNRSGAAGDTATGRATRIGVAEDYADGGYRLGYFTATPDFDAWGSPLAGEARGVELQGHYDIRRGWVVRNTLRLHTRTRAAALVDTFSISGHYSQPGTGRPWALTGRIVQRDDAPDQRQPLSFRLASRTRHWHDWHIDTAMGWYQGNVANPQNRPVEGGLWSLSFDRGFEFAGFATRLRPRFALGGSSRDDADYAGLAGLGLVFPNITDQLAVNMDYASAGWVPTAHDGGDLRLTLNFTQNPGQILAPVRSWADRF